MGYGNPFIELLQEYFGARGKRIKDEVVRVLCKNPLDFTPEEGDLYHQVVAPSREFLKVVLRDILGLRPGERQEWEWWFLRENASVIEQIVGEVLAEGTPGSLAPETGGGGGPMPGKGIGARLGADAGSTPEEAGSGEAGGGRPGLLGALDDEVLEKEGRGWLPPPTEVGDPHTDGEGARGSGDNGGNRFPEAPAPSAHPQDLPSTQVQAEDVERGLAGGSKRWRAYARGILKALGWLFTLAVCLLVLGAAFLLVSPRFGIRAHPVLSGSMEPALKVGGLILCRQVPVEEVEVGDIIGFNTPGGQKVTHRVIEITESDGKRWFRTKGDANEDPDPDVFTIPGGKVDRVVFHLPYAGYVSSFLNSKAGFFIFIVVPGVILLSLFGYDLWKAAVEIRKGRAGEKRDGG